MKIKLLDAHCKPYRAYPTDSGLDLRATLEKAILIRPLENKVIPVG